MAGFNKFRLTVATVVLAIGFISAAPTMPLDECRRMAAEGDAEAQWQLGQRYEKGDGVRQDSMRAIAQYKKAADQGHKAACAKLASCYETGKLVGKNQAQAAKYREMAEGEGLDGDSDNSTKSTHGKTAKEDEESDESLMKDVLRFTSGQIDYTKATELFKLSGKIEEKPLRQLILKASAIALIYSGKTSIYENNVRRKINDYEEFESAFKQPCEICDGDGKAKTKCLTCHGTGRCPASNCRDGRIIIRQITGNTIGNCGSCNGTGQCKRCHGEGVLKTRCQRCNGQGIAPSKKVMEEMFDSFLNDASTYFKRKREEAAEAERREEERKREEAFEEEQRAKGFVKYDGQWMTPAEKERRVRDAKFARLIVSKSRTRQTFKVLQVLEEGRALCISIRFDRYGNRVETDEIFCLLYTASINKTVVDGEIFTNDLYWSGTYSYTTVQGAPKKVLLFAIELPDAVREARRQGFDEY